MKTIFTLVFTLFAAIATNLYSQSFEGRIVTKTEVVDAPQEMQSAKSMMETTMTTYIKDAHSRMETTSTFMGKMIVISDYAKKEIVSCMDMMGQKKAIVSSMSEPVGKTEIPADMTFKETGKTKNILGYTCHEGTGTYVAKDGKSATMNIWYCKDIPNRNTQYPALSGMPMEYSMMMQGMTMKISTIEINKESVPDSMFIIPEGYVLTTQEEMMKSMGGKK
jgi:GLPGLI family protein